MLGAGHRHGHCTALDVVAVHTVVVAAADLIVGVEHPYGPCVVVVVVDSIVAAVVADIDVVAAVVVGAVAFFLC